VILVLATLNNSMENDDGELEWYMCVFIASLQWWSRA